MSTISTTNVLVETVEGEKKIFLRSFDLLVFPREYTVVKEAKAQDFAEEHVRNFFRERDAENYFDRLKQS